jgi:hypothetical protein
MVVWKIRNRKTQEYLLLIGEKNSMWDEVGTTWSTYTQVMKWLDRFTTPENSELVQFKITEISRKEL